MLSSLPGLVGAEKSRKWSAACHDVNLMSFGIHLSQEPQSLGPGGLFLISHGNGPWSMVNGHYVITLKTWLVLSPDETIECLWLWHRLPSVALRSLQFCCGHTLARDSMFQQASKAKNSELVNTLHRMEAEDKPQFLEHLDNYVQEHWPYHNQKPILFVVCPC